MGHPMILAYVSSEESLERLDDIRCESWKISHPGSATETEIEEIVRNGKAVVAMTMSIHASEVGGTQVASSPRGPEPPGSADMKVASWTTPFFTLSPFSSSWRCSSAHTSLSVPVSARRSLNCHTVE